MQSTRLIFPSKPHFFQPILPGFEDQFLIPTSFFKYLKEPECKEAVLTSNAGKTWPVKITGRLFKDGWREFTKHHSLQVGDFLVFRHEGDMVFHVTVFDRSACERDYPLFSVKQEIPETQEKEPQTPARPSGSEKPKKREQSAMPGSYFVTKLTSYSSKRSRLAIPKYFARPHGLANRKCDMIVKDEEGRSWPTMLWHKNSDGQVFIGSGWTNCRLANRLKKGDSLMFELIKSGKTPLFKMIRLSTNLEAKRERSCDESGTNSTLEASYPGNSKLNIPKGAKGSASGNPEKEKQPSTNFEENGWPSGLQNPFFVASLASCNKKWDRKLVIPMNFARLHCAVNRVCNMILIDQKGRSWPARLWYKEPDGQVYIADGWKTFCVAQELKPGDSFIFELVGNGETLVLKMHSLKTENEQIYNAVQAGSCSTRYPSFSATVRPSYKSHKIRIPTKFAVRHDIARKCSNATLVDERGTSWPVSIVSKPTDIYIGRGWNRFAVDNGAREGDVFMFELIKGREKPVFRIHGTRRNPKYRRES